MGRRVLVLGSPVLKKRRQNSRLWVPDEDGRSENWPLDLRFMKKKGGVGAQASLLVLKRLWESHPMTAC